MKRSSGSKSSIWNSTWMYVLVTTLIIISAALFLSMNFTEYFTQPNVYQEPLATLEYFYLETCPHCIEFSPTWEAAVAKVKSENMKVQLVKYNANDKDVGAQRAELFNVKSFPTVLYVKNSPTEYNGERTVDGIIAFLNSMK